MGYSLFWEFVVHKIFEVSSVSVEDYINISAHYFCLLRGEQDHDKLLKARGYSETQLKALNRKKTIHNYTILNLRFKVALTNFKYPYMGYVILLLENYERGVLPFPGSASEQPAQIVDILNLLQTIKSEVKIAIEKEQQKSNSRLPQRKK